MTNISLFSWIISPIENCSGQYSADHLRNDSFMHFICELVRFSGDPFELPIRHQGDLRSDVGIPVRIIPAGKKGARFKVSFISNFSILSIVKVASNCGYNHANFPVL